MEVKPGRHGERTALGQMSASAANETVPEGTQLLRLQRLADVLYALVIFQLFLMIPTPETTGKTWESGTDYLSDHGVDIAVSVVGVAVTIIYWLQSNQLLGVLRKTDAIHTTFSIFQLFFLLVLLYSMKLGIEIDTASAGTWAFESAAATAVGICSLLAYARARRKGLLRANVPESEAKRLAIRYRAEPITTGISFPFAFVSGAEVFGFNLVWEASWFLYPIIVFVVNRYAKQTIG